MWRDNMMFAWKYRSVLALIVEGIDSLIIESSGVSGVCKINLKLYVTWFQAIKIFVLAIWASFKREGSFQTFSW